MLSELRRVRQVPGDHFRRCFSDKSLELVVWHEADGVIYGFQLSYDLERNPRTLTWTRKRGFSHASIDDGEESVLANRSPMLRTSPECDAVRLREAFIAACGALPAGEKAFVEGKLTEFAGGS